MIICIILVTAILASASGMILGCALSNGARRDEYEGGLFLEGRAE